MKKFFFFLLMLIPALHLHAQEMSKTFVIYFDHDSYALSDKARTTLDSIMPFAKQLTHATISIIGYTDDSGTAEYNKILAVDRANAAKGYLENKGLNVADIAGNIYYDEKPALPEMQRRAIITVNGNKVLPSIAGNGFEQQEFTGPQGTIVIANVPKGSSGAIKVREFFTPESMIAGGMYCMTMDDRVLQTDGMIEICRNETEMDPSGEFYTVKIPAKNRAMINTLMTVWLSVRKSDGSLRWENTTIEITSDPEKKYYVFKVPVGTEGCIKINMDMPCVRENGCKVVYIATDKPYDFTNVSVGAKEMGTLYFSAKVNDTLWAFTGSRGAKEGNMVFTGSYNEYGKEKTLTVALKDMKHTYNRRPRSHVYYIYDPTERSGFWAWLRRQFRSA